MGTKLLWLGLTFIMAQKLFTPIPMELVGVIIMIVGVILLFLDK
jgi:hypothetical protein